MAKQKEISVIDYAGQNNLTVIEVYRLIDMGEIQSKTVKKKTIILL